MCFSINQRKLILLLLTLLHVNAVISAENGNHGEEEDLAFIYGNEEYVSIASGYKQPIIKAPAVASIISAEDIRAIGASSIDEVLETIPGIHVSVIGNAYTPVYTIRGIYSEFNQQVLMLINGIPITHIFSGDRGRAWSTPVHSIKRIEVIRGPGSAVYGADAYSGVINIITNDYDSVYKNEVGVKYGSFNSKEAWWVQKFSIGELKTAFSIELEKIDSHNETINADAQSFFDSIFLTNASLAPNDVNTEKESIETHINIAYKRLQINIDYQGRFNVGSGVGSAAALDPSGKRNVTHFLSSLTYDLTTPKSNWDTKLQLSYYYVSEEQQQNLFPNNTIISFGGPPDFFPNGVIGNTSLNERHYQGSISTIYYGFNNHTIRGGIGFHYGEIYNIEEEKNFNSIGLSLGSLIDVSDDKNLVYILPQDRELYYAFIQDEWNFADDWSLTAGIRYDHYSDFGHTINPRLALVWQANYNLTMKLLYSNAFRAPSFAEQFLINNPVTIGNPELEPETIDTVEFAINYQPIKKLNLGLNIFAYEMQDIIRFVTPPGSTIGVAQNTGRQTGYGLEAEFKWDATDDFTLRGNYAFQNSTDESTDTDAGNAPHHQIYFRGDWHLTEHLQLTSQVNWISKRERVAGDLRDDLDGYSTVDLSLRYGNEYNPWSIAITVRNLFDEDAREPTVAPGLIPNDLPLPGIAAYIEASIRF